MPTRDQGHFICDVDGVLLDIVTPTCEILNRDFPGHNLTPADIRTWDWEYVLAFPPEYWTEFWQKLWSMEAEPYPGANDFIHILRGIGFKPVGLSTRPMNWKGLDPANIANEAGERDNKKLDLEYTIFVDNHGDKNQKAQDLWPDARFSIEDSPKNARDLGMIDHIVCSILIDRPWNRGSISIMGNWTRMYNYSHIVQELLNGGLLR